MTISEITGALRKCLGVYCVYKWAKCARNEEMKRVYGEKER